MRVRDAALLVLLAWPLQGRAQEATSTITEAGNVPPPAPPPPYPAPLAPAPVLEPPSPVVNTFMGLRVMPTQRQRDRWRRGRIVSAFGTAFGVVGLGLSASSVIYVLVKDYPPSANDVLAPKAEPTDPGPMLAYTGASLSTVSFLFSAGGLGAQHSVLRHLGIDPGLTHFGAGTTFGILGTLFTATSYFFGFTGYLDSHDQANAILATSVTGTVLCGIGSILYLVDSSRMKKRWNNLTTF